MSWRDTLFVWNGQLEITNDKAVEWSGAWVGCEACPDAEEAELPDDEAFENSSTKFHVSGTLHQRGDQFFLTFTDGGWDLISDDDDDDDSIKRYPDAKHSLLLPTTERSALKGIRKIVAAVGENDFGSFVSAGFVTVVKAKRRGLQLVLARRYLENDDVRSKWSVTSLYHKLVEKARPETPWKVGDLHVETRRRKRPREK